MQKRKKRSAIFEIEKKYKRRNSEKTIGAVELKEATYVGGSWSWKGYGGRVQKSIRQVYAKFTRQVGTHVGME